MEILIVNDDGWGTPGIRLLAKEMTRFGHVTVIAPDSPRSGFGACITATKPIYMQKVESDMADVRVFVTTGTPVDCVKLAVEVVFKGQKPDLLVSGINHGNNCSVNVLYSGTMGACFAGCEHGILSIGFSIDDHSMEVDLQYLQPWISQITQHLLDEGIPPLVCYNVNAPVGEIAGLRWARSCRGRWTKEMAPHTDEEGNTYYMLGGEFVNDEPEAEDTDWWMLHHGFISIQPVSIDVTHYASL